MAKFTKSPRSPNRFLASLRPTDFEVLRPHLKYVELVHEVVLYKTGDTIDRVDWRNVSIGAATVAVTAWAIADAPGRIAPRLDRRATLKLLSKGD